MLRVVGGLQRPPALRLFDGGRHRVGDVVGVHDDLAVQVPRRAARRLDQRGAGAQISFLVRVEDRDQRYLGNVEALTEQVDADQAVELPEAQVADDRHAVEGVDIGVEVAHADARLLVVLREVFGHPLRQRRHEHALVTLRAQADLVE